MMILTPVLMAIRHEFPLRTPGAVAEQREAARLALRVCASHCGAPDSGWEQDAKRVPLVNQGYFWSISHKRQWAAAVIADCPVGIDIEHIAPRRNELYAELANDEEWRIAGGRDWDSFYRVWTAKEATLKANGRGIGGFADCVVTDVPDARHMVMTLDGASWRVEHYYVEDHIAAVAGDCDAIEWRIA